MGGTVNVDTFTKEELEDLRKLTAMKLEVKRTELRQLMQEVREEASLLEEVEQELDERRMLEEEQQ